MSTKAQIKASTLYDKKNTKSVLLKLNLKTDKDIIEHLNSVGSKMGYIKSLIRKDMEEKMNKKYDLNLIKIGIASSCDYFKDTSLKELVDRKFISEDTAIKILSTHYLHEHRVDAFGDTIYNKVYYWKRLEINLAFFDVKKIQ